VPDRFTSIIDVHVILRRAGKILLLRRAGNVYASGQLCLPSGHLEEGENILEAGIRETKEETGIALDPATLRLALSIHQRNPRTTHTRIGFAFEPGHWDGEPVIGEPAKCSQLVWADPSSLPSNTVQYTAAIIGAIQRGATFCTQRLVTPSPRADRLGRGAGEGRGPGRLRGIIQGRLVLPAVPAGCPG
jgi:8-oxo-dGTP pyrophosphatase MutT (NUDIX family)